MVVQNFLFTFRLYLYSGGAQTFHKSRSHLKILGARWVTRSKFHTAHPEISGATLQNLVAQELCTLARLPHWRVWFAQQRFPLRFALSVTDIPCVFTRSGSATSLRTVPSVPISTWQQIFLFSRTFRWNQAYPGSHSMVTRLKRPWRDADHSPPTTVEVKNACSCTATDLSAWWCTGSLHYVT
jgi:hypothetical protein